MLLIVKICFYVPSRLSCLVGFTIVLL